MWVLVYQNICTWGSSCDGVSLVFLKETVIFYTSANVPYAYD